MSPIACTLVGNSTVERCGNILAGGLFENSYSVTAAFAGDNSHAPSKGTFEFNTGIAPKTTPVVTPEFPLGSVTMMVVLLGALAVFGFTSRKRKSSEE